MAGPGSTPGSNCPEDDESDCVDVDGSNCAGSGESDCVDGNGSNCADAGDDAYGYEGEDVGEPEGEDAGADEDEDEDDAGEDDEEDEDEDGESEDCVDDELSFGAWAESPAADVPEAFAPQPSPEPVFDLTTAATSPPPSFALAPSPEHVPTGLATPTPLNARLNPMFNPIRTAAFLTELFDTAPLHFAWTEKRSRIPRCKLRQLNQILRGIQRLQTWPTPTFAFRRSPVKQSPL